MNDIEIVKVWQEAQDQLSSLGMPVSFKDDAYIVEKYYGTDGEEAFKTVFEVAAFAKGAVQGISTERSNSLNKTNASHREVLQIKEQMVELGNRSRKIRQRLDALIRIKLVKDRSKIIQQIKDILDGKQ